MYNNNRTSKWSCRNITFSRVVAGLYGYVGKKDHVLILISKTEMQGKHKAKICKGTRYKPGWVCIPFITFVQS